MGAVFRIALGRGVLPAAATDHPGGAVIRATRIYANRFGAIRIRGIPTETPLHHVPINVV